MLLTQGQTEPETQKPAAMEEKPSTAQGEGQTKEDIVDPGLFTKNSYDTSALSKTLSSRKAMKREYVPKTIIQFLRERKSFHENQEQLHKHMKEAHKLLSPAGFVRQTSNMMNCPELVLDPEAKQSENSNQGSGQGAPFIIAVRKYDPDCRGRKFRENMSR